MGASNHYFDLQEMNIGSVPDKNVCTNHFMDSKINNYIRRNYSDGYCDYCQKEKKVLPLEKVLKFMMKGILNFFEDAANFQPYESRNGGYLWGTKSVEDIIYSIGLETDPYEVTEDIISSIEEIGWSNYYDFYNSPHDDLIQRWSFFSQIVKNQTRYFFKYRKSDNTFPDENFSANDTLEDLGKLIKKFRLYTTIPAGTKLYRGRQHKIIDTQKIKNINELISPSKENAKFANRFSPSGVAMFYGSTMKDAIIPEIYNPELKSKKRITIGEFITQEFEL